MADINRGDLVLVPCRNGMRTAEMILEHLKDAAMIDTRTKVFGDGEVKTKLLESVRGKDVYIVQNTLDPRNPDRTSENIIELLLMTDAVKRADANHISIVLPYMSYCKQERKSGREPISAKVMIDMLRNRGAERIITMDLHAPAIEGFSSVIQVQNLYASALILDYFLEKVKFDGVFVAPDPGAGKMVKHYSKVTGMPIALGYKYRDPDSHHDFEEQRLLGDVKDMDAAIIDDQSAGSGTLINMARILKKAGAKKVYGAVAHAMLLLDAEEKFRKVVEEGILTELVCTNTLMQPDDLLRRNPYIKVLDSLKIFAEAIKETHKGGSISRLYEPRLRESMFGEEHR